MLLGIAAVALLGLEDHGVEIVGQIDAGLPHLGLPDVPGGHDWLALVGPAAGVLLVGYAEGLAAAKTYAARAGYDIDPNRELVGLGAANLGSGLASGMVVNGSLSKTAVNGGAGARSQVSSLTVAALTVVTLLFLTGLFESLPEATLAAVVIAAVIELVDVPALVRLYRIWTGRLGTIYGWAARPDFIAAAAAMLGVLVFDTLPGLFIGIAVSLLLLVYRSSRPYVARLARRRAPGRVAGHRAPPRPDPARRRSWSSASRPACSSPTPTTCATPSAPPPPGRTRGRWSSTPRPRRSSTSPRPRCWSSSARTWPTAGRPGHRAPGRTGARRAAAGSHGRGPERGQRAGDLRHRRRRRRRPGRPAGQ